MISPRSVFHQIDNLPIETNAFQKSFTPNNENSKIFFGMSAQVQSTQFKKKKASYTKKFQNRVDYLSQPYYARKDSNISNGDFKSIKSMGEFSTKNQYQSSSESGMISIYVPKQKLTEVKENIPVEQMQQMGLNLGIMPKKNRLQSENLITSDMLRIKSQYKSIELSHHANNNNNKKSRQKKTYNCTILIIIDKIYEILEAIVDDDLSFNLKYRKTQAQIRHFNDFKSRIIKEHQLSEEVAYQLSYLMEVMFYEQQKEQFEAKFSLMAIEGEVSYNSLISQRQELRQFNHIISKNNLQTQAIVDDEMQEQQFQAGQDQYNSLNQIQKQQSTNEQASQSSSSNSKKQREEGKSKSREVESQLLQFICALKLFKDSHKALSDDEIAVNWIKLSPAKKEDYIYNGLHTKLELEFKYRNQYIINKREYIDILKKGQLNYQPVIEMVKQNTYKDFIFNLKTFLYMLDQHQ
ncbi:UNKNOWN [Stylonychia lemnae]|uniref:Uncharacterized protein n=1 Tax=Stylonychia lemnae TaxID=5949 RepID=A0A077ZYQ1_STYLE|nr:UNKNOWN [Stylonychia lemnae]|eukprot:CDW74742.1 UNKNOWN [Stylonychia lemnae]